MREAVVWGWTPYACEDCPDFGMCRLPGGKCREVGRQAPPEWTPDFAVAVEVYNETVSLSGYDINGYPQLTRLETVMEYKSGEVESKELFFMFIKALHGMSIKLRNERNAY